MDEDKPAEGSPVPASAVGTPPRPAASEKDRTAQVVVGGLLAGLGLSIAAALVMHVVQAFSPNGYAYGITGSVWLEILLAGPVFGIGVAIALAALIPAAGPGPAATRTDSPEPTVRPQAGPPG
jgi:hypothetical protein